MSLDEMCRGLEPGVPVGQVGFCQLGMIAAMTAFLIALIAIPAVEVWRRMGEGDEGDDDG